MRLDEVLIIRALNATRQLYFPTYAGIRLLGEQLPKYGDAFISRLILRKLNSQDTWRYKNFQMYKGVVRDAGQERHEYRNCLAPSPITALGEAVVLMYLSQEMPFQSSEQVYSYRWPRSRNSGWNFEFYASGYAQRNAEISALLKKPGSVAVVTDVKRFYPSINTQNLLAKLESKLRACRGDVQSAWRSFMAFFDQMIVFGPGGIPVGPSCGHLLGQIAMDSVDRELGDKFGKCYFRYVDDIVVICDKSQKQEVLDQISKTLEACYLTVNTAKTLFVDGQTWDSQIGVSDLGDGDDSFRIFTGDLTTYLAFHPQKANALSTGFSDHGLSIPTFRLLALSAYPRFRYFLTRRKAQGGLVQAARVYLSSEKDFFERGMRLKDAYENRLLTLLDIRGGAAQESHRWLLQRVRRIVNILFYLRSFDEWADKAKQLEKFPELIEQRALAKALSSGDVTAILPFYGRGPAAFAELWSERSSDNAEFNWPDGGLSRAETDSLVTLVLHGAVAELPEQIAVQSSAFRLAGAGATYAPVVRTTPDLTFDDEIQSLALGTSRLRIAELIRSRYALKETSALDALSLLSSEYMS